MSPQSKHTEAVFQRCPRLYVMVVAELGHVKVSQVVLIVMAVRGRGKHLRQRLKSRKRAAHLLRWKCSPFAQNPSFWRSQYQGMMVQDSGNRTVVPWEWRLSEARRQAESAMARPLEPTVSLWNLTLDITLLNFGFALIWLCLHLGSSLLLE